MMERADKLAAEARALADECLTGRINPYSFCATEVRKMSSAWPHCALQIAGHRAGYTDGDHLVREVARTIAVAAAAAVVIDANDVDPTAPDRPHNLYMALMSFADVLEEK